MLVLSRKKNESIVINNDITVTVVEIRGDKVRLGIVAPKEVPVHRQEVFDAIHGKPGAEPAPSTGAAKSVDPSGRNVGVYLSAIPNPSSSRRPVGPVRLEGVFAFSEPRVSAPGGA